MIKTPTRGLRRVAALGLGLAMIGGLSFVAVAPASAAPETYTATGTVLGQDLAGDSAPLAGALFAIDGGSSVVTDAEGTFSLQVEEGSHSLTVSAEGYQSTTGSLDMPAADIAVGDFTLMANEPEAPATYSITGVVTAKDANPAFAPTVVLSGIEGSSPWQTQVDADGNFTFEHLSPGADLSLTISADGYGTVTKAVPVTDADVDVTIELLPNLSTANATATLTGDSTVGSTLSVTTSGWPEGTKLSYEWFWNGGYMGGAIGGATGTSYTVTKEFDTRLVGVIVTGTLDGFAPSEGVYSNFSDRITALQQPAAAAPVANSSDLTAWLAANNVTALPQTDVGLPAGDLDPTVAQTANVPWTAPDSFVDVYVYSTPILVGSFPVIDGVVAVKLSTDILGQLDAGAHTLVITGQSSGAVQAVSFNVTATLAETGANPAPLGATAALLALLGVAALVVVRRRRQHV